MRRTDRMTLELCRWILGDGEAGPGKAARAKELIALLERKPRKKIAGPTIKQEKRAKKAAHRESTKEIRAAVMDRAGHFCECGCLRSFWSYQAEMDHFDGGSGKSQRQSVENCWLLTRWCHQQRHAGLPSVAHWNDRFAAHAAKHNYPSIRHIEHTALAAGGDRQ